jgi:hypothetical protein
MTKEITFIVAWLALSGIVALAQDIPDEMLIDNWGYATDLKGPVAFLHKSHYTDFKLDCSECHHGYKEGDTVQKCRSCHNPIATDAGPTRLQNAYHLNCKDCHEERYYAGKPAGPFKKCNDCHEALKDDRVTYVGSGDCGGIKPCYNSVQAAVDGTPNAYDILISDGAYTEQIILNAPKGLRLLGGWNASFTSQTGKTILRHAPKALQGSLTMESLSIKP